MIITVIVFSILALVHIFLAYAVGYKKNTALINLYEPKKQADRSLNLDKLCRLIGAISVLSVVACVLAVVAFSSSNRSLQNLSLGLYVLSTLPMTYIYYGKKFKKYRR